MRIGIVGISSGIGSAAATLLAEKGHWVTDARRDDPVAIFDCLVWCAGHDYEVCITQLLERVKSDTAQSYIVVTSEHGTHAVGLDYAEYAAMKAAQKMVCRTIARSLIPCVDVSPAFVIDSGKNKRINNSASYREQIQSECVGIMPVTSKDVAAAILFAVENVKKLTGSTIVVSAGWRV